MIICPQCQTINEVQSTRCATCASPLLVGEPMLDDDPFVGRILGGRFQLLARLGSGEIGMVYRGLDRQTGQEAAIKIIHPDVAATFGEQLLHSARQLVKLRHPKIASVLAAARDTDGTLFVATDHVRGQTLKSLLEATGPLGPRRAADILFQLCSALAPIQRLNRAHANLKPENVFLVEREGGADFVQIIDVGVPELFGVRQTADGPVIIGTPKYFSPEQASGRPVGLPSDQFSLGVIGYQLLTGALPFFGATPDQLLAAIVTTTPTAVSKRTAGVVLPPKLEQIIDRCLAKEPGQRYPDLRALATDLAEVIKSTQPEPAPKARPKRPFQNASTVVAGADALADLMDGDDDGTMVRDIPSPPLGLSSEATPNLTGPMPSLMPQPRTAPMKAPPPPPTPARLPAPPPPTQNDLAVIPEPLLVTGAIDSDDLARALADAAAEVDGILPKRASSAPAPVVPAPVVPASSPPRSKGPRLDSDLDAALAAALADVGGADEAPPPPPKGPKVDPFAGMSLDDVPGSAAGRAAEAASQASRAPGSARLTTEIMSAIDEELDDAPASGPAKVSPLATAADLAALAPPPTARDTQNKTQRKAARGQGSQGSLALLLLTLVVGGGAVYWLVLREEPVAPQRPTPANPPSMAGAQPSAAPSAPAPASLAEAPSSAGGPASAADGVAAAGGAPAPGSVADDMPATVRAELQRAEDEKAKAEAAKRTFEVALESTPAGATVTCGATSIGPTPAKFVYSLDRPCEFTFTLDGHETVTRKLDLSAPPAAGSPPPSLSVELKKAADRPAAPPPRPKPLEQAKNDAPTPPQPKPKPKPAQPKPPKADFKDPFAD